MSTKIWAGVLVQSATCRLGACFPVCQLGPPVAPPLGTGSPAPCLCLPAAGPRPRPGGGGAAVRPLGKGAPEPVCRPVAVWPGPTWPRWHTLQRPH